MTAPANGRRPTLDGELSEFERVLLARISTACRVVPRVPAARRAASPRRCAALRSSRSSGRSRSAGFAARIGARASRRQPRPGAVAAVVLGGSLASSGLRTRSVARTAATRRGSSAPRRGRHDEPLRPPASADAPAARLRRPPPGPVSSSVRDWLRSAPRAIRVTPRARRYCLRQWFPSARHLARLKPRPRRPCGGASRRRAGQSLADRPTSADASVNSGRWPARLPAAPHGTGLISPGDPCLSKQQGQNVGKVIEIKGVVIDARLPGRAARDLQRARSRSGRTASDARRGGAAAPRRRPRPRGRDGLDRRPRARRRRRRHRRADHGARRRGDARAALERDRRAGRRASRRRRTDVERWPIHRDPPAFRDLSPKIEIFETGHQGHRPDRAVRQAAARSASSAARASARRSSSRS